MEFLGRDFTKLYEKLWFSGQRKGQAFFNALSVVDPESAEMLRGSRYDPFYYDSLTAIDAAIEWLTNPE